MRWRGPLTVRPRTSILRTRTQRRPRMIYPSLRYRDARAGIDWLKDTFGFEERVVYANDDGSVAHAELSFGPSIVMLGSEKDDSYGSHVGEGWLYVAVPDP